MKEYLDRFGVTKELITKVLSKGLSKGGDYCDLYFQHSITNLLGLEDNIVNKAYSNADFGVGIRVLNGEQTGYSFTEDISEKAMLKAAQTAATIANSNPTVNVAELKEYTHPEYYTSNIPWETTSVERKVNILEDINKRIKQKSDYIIKANVNFIDDTTYILFANSEGKITTDYRPMALVSASCIAEKDGLREANNYSLSVRSGLEFLTETEITHLVDSVVKGTLKQFEAIVPDGGEMEVVLAAGSSGILLHEAIGHGMEADFNRKNTSIFSDKIGKKVAREFVTIVDNGTNQGIRGSLNIDDEGNDTEETILVENGILKSYLHDRISAKHYGVKPTGNGRRQSFRHVPMPRMRNTYMLNGPHSPDEIIQSVKKGIYAESFTNGQVNIGGGDYTFYVKSGYLIENGKFTTPIKDINIIGNGPESLENITMVGNDFKMAEGGWTCGKNGQGVPVSQGLPTIKVAKINVGGKAL